MTPDQIDHIVLLVKEAEREQHGTMLLIAENAESEAQRLSNQSTQITPMDLTPSIPKNLTSIDGAIILDPDSTCFAIGAILDGMATQDGDPSRGARYNTALRYVGTSDTPCLAIVVSEDGGINFIPDLLPPIKESEIYEKIETLKEIKNGDLVYDNFQSKFHTTMQWFSEYHFYLSSEHCQLINELKEQIATKAICKDEISKKKIREYREYREDLSFDPKMYYIEE